MQSQDKSNTVISSQEVPEKYKTFKLLMKVFPKVSKTINFQLLASASLEAQQIIAFLKFVKFYQKSILCQKNQKQNENQQVEEEQKGEYLLEQQEERQMNQNLQEQNKKRIIKVLGESIDIQQLSEIRLHTIKDVSANEERKQSEQPENIRIQKEFQNATADKREVYYSFFLDEETLNNQQCIN